MDAIVTDLTVITIDAGAAAKAGAPVAATTVATMSGHVRTSRRMQSLWRRTVPPKQAA
jgi:hypothetical protein